MTSDKNTNGQLKLLCVVPSLIRAGAETQVVSLINGFNPEQIKKYLFTFESRLDQIGDVDQRNITCINVARRHKYDLKPVREMAKTIDDEDIDVIHCSLQFSLLLAWIARWIAKRNPRLIVAIHTTKNRNIKEELQDRFIYRWLIPQCEAVIFVCHAQKQYWLERYPHLEKKSRVIYNGVNTSKFDPVPWKEKGEKLRNNLNIPADALVISCIAGFRPEKGHAILIRALKKIDNTPYLLLAGEGELQPEIRKLVASLGLAEQVKFLGMLNDVRPVLATSDLSLLASTAVETFSMAMLESMSMQTPVLASDIGGLSEAIIPGETGFLFTPGDEEALSLILSDITSGKYDLKNMGYKSRKMVLKSFSNDQMIQNTENLLLAKSSNK